MLYSKFMKPVTVPVPRPFQLRQHLVDELVGKGVPEDLSESGFVLLQLHFARVRARVKVSRVRLANLLGRDPPRLSTLIKS